VVITKCHLVVAKKKILCKNAPKSPDLKEEFFSATGDNGFFPLVTKRYQDS
jgi:hypothetical protein